jgi:hypothetical protein
MDDDTDNDDKRAKKEGGQVCRLRPLCFACLEVFYPANGGEEDSDNRP